MSIKRNPKPRIHFKEKQNTWVETELKTLLDYEQPTLYLVTNTDYNDSYSVPVLTAGKSFILGYTNEQKRVFTNTPIILFDDFTTSSQYVNFPFKVKSSACKILKLKDSRNNLKIIFEYMQLINFSPEEHKRYWVSEYQNFKIFIPSFIEQEKIGDTIKSFDKLIEDKEKKLTKLEQIKKTMLSKMFPKNETCIPEIRFKGFHDKWKKLKFEDIAHFYSGGTPNTANREYYGGNIPFIKSAEIYYSYTQEHLTQIGLENSSAKWVKKGDLLYALYGANSGEVAISKIDGVINQAVLCIKNISKKFHAYFLYSFLLVNKKNIVDRLLQGGQGNLSATLIKKIQIQLPSMDEQTKIGGYFEKLDRHIELQNQEIQKLKQIKHSLLTNMLKVDINNQVEKTQRKEK